MIEDTTLVFQKYASLQTYVPVAPEERFAWSSRKYQEGDESSETIDADYIKIEDFFYTVEPEEEKDDFDEDDEEEEED